MMNATWLMKKFCLINFCLTYILVNSLHFSVLWICVWFPHTHLFMCIYCLTKTDIEHGHGSLIQTYNELQKFVVKKYTGVFAV